MNLDLVAIAAIIVTSLLELAGVVYVARLVHLARDKMDADDAALYLQGKRVQEILREMRAELRTR